MKIENGNLVINLSDDLASSPECLRAFGQNVLFDELLIKSIAQFILTGEVTWEEGENPWWICHGDGKRSFEELRRVIAALGDEASKVLIADLTEQRKKVERERDIYQNRAWRAERMVQWNDALLRNNFVEFHSDRDLEDLRKICAVKAHAQESDL